MLFLIATNNKRKKSFFQIFFHGVAEKSRSTRVLLGDLKTTFIFSS